MRSWKSPVTGPSSSGEAVTFRLGCASLPVAVVGAGVKTPAGNDAGELWEDLCAGRPSAEVFSDDRLPPGTAALVCRVSGFDPAAYLTPIEVRRLDRSHALAIGAAADALGQCGELPAPARRAVVCGIGLGAASTYEEQVSRLLGQGAAGGEPADYPDGHAEFGRRPPVAPVRLRGTMPDRIRCLRVRRRGHRRGRGTAAPGGSRHRAGRWRRLAGRLRRDVLFHAAGRDEPQCELPRACLPSLRHRPRRVRHGRGRRVRRTPATRGCLSIGARAARARPRARLLR